MLVARLKQWLSLLLFVLTLIKAQGDIDQVEITYLGNAIMSGAVCLDGSPPAYHFDKGFGYGINNWLVHIEGGGWCNSFSSCLARKNTSLGSSRFMQKKIPFLGILSNERAQNPDFYNWNRIKVRYCDGSSFTGDVEVVDLKTKLHFRGERIFGYVMHHLLGKGMKNAERVLFSGSSAGGVATMLHCDRFRALFPNEVDVKCLSDAGFVINIKDISGAWFFNDYILKLVETHGSRKNLPASCTSRLPPELKYLCFLPQYVAPGIQTPLFVVNAAYDTWQINNILIPDLADPTCCWNDCKNDIYKCSKAQLRVFEGFRSELIRAIKAGINIPSSGGRSSSRQRGMFVDSCFGHMQAENKWLDFPEINKTVIARSVGEWYFERSRPDERIDCPFNCNPTCHNNLYDRTEEPPLLEGKCPSPYRSSVSSY